jgi:hypothetical protein
MAVAGVKLPEPPPLENVTVPLGFVAPDAAVSVAVAVQTVDVPTVTDPGEQTIVVAVGWSCTGVTVRGSHELVVGA